ncbi:MAG: PstS family phosphate ABC transporter substrate-binding protein [Bacteriovoracaceae bacterium]
MKKVIVISLLLMSFLSACSKNSGHKVYQNKGSDTLVNLAQAWAEKYRTVNPNLAFAVTGGGTGTGIAALINNTVDIANASRSIKPEEKEQAQKNSGKEVKEHIVALDALIILVHKDNPMTQISLEELACLYGQDGNCETWDSINTKIPTCTDNKVIRISRQSNSGTYQYFREKVIGEKKEFRLGSMDMNGSKEVVDLLEHTPCAIAYSGLGYITDKVKALCVSVKKGEPCVEPTKMNAQSHKYPLSRPLFMYTLGEPTDDIKGYLAWLTSDEGQKVVEELGFVSIPK